MIVVGIIKNASIAYSAKYPTLPHSKHYVTQLLICCFQVRHLHVETEGTLAAIRNEYWPIDC